MRAILKEIGQKSQAKCGPNVMKYGPPGSNNEHCNLARAGA